MSSRARSVLLFSLLAAVAGCGDNLTAAPDGGTAPAEPDATAAPDAAPPALCDEEDPGASLRQLEGVTSVSLSQCGFAVAQPARCYLIDFTQPVDHATAGGPTFAQRLLLIHRGCDRPTLVADWGYELQDYFFDDELSVLYQTNSLWVEHRYQGVSVPAEADWSWSALTIENGARDQHAVVAAVRRHYGGRVVLTGASKGGVTAIYHGYFFPDDLDGSVPYVAPASRARIDPAYQDHLLEALTAPCAQPLRDAQVDALTTRREMLLPRIEELVGAGGGPGWLESLDRSLDWGFWQYYGADYCGDVPAADATDDAFWQFFYDYSGLGWFAGQPGGSWWSYSALDYEWLTEQGFALQVGEHVSSLIVDPAATVTMEDGFRAEHPEVALPAFDGSVTAAARRWGEEEAEHMLLVYGEFDPWSGGALEAPARPTSGRFVVPAATHAASLLDLPVAERDAALALATPMFGVEPELPLTATARRAAAARDAFVARALRRAQLGAVARDRLAPLSR